MLVTQRGDGDVRPQARAVLAHAPALFFEAALVGRDHEFVGALAGGSDLGRIKNREVLTQDVTGSVAIDALRTGVPSRHVARRIEDENRVILDALDE